MMPVNKSGLGPQDPVTSASKKYLSLIRTSRKLIEAVTGERSFSTADHLLALREGRRDGQNIEDDTNGSKLKGLVKYLEALILQLFIRAKKTGSWLIVWGTTLTSTVLAATGFCNFLCVCYDVTSPNLKNKYDGYSLSFFVRHRLICRNGGLGIAHHNKVRDHILYLA